MKREERNEKEHLSDDTSHTEGNIQGYENIRTLVDVLYEYIMCIACKVLQFP